MPFSSEGVSPGIALAVSGGGFRATLFHIGSLWRLNETGLLPKLDRVSSISGGSITAAFLGLKFGQLAFDAVGRATNFEPLIVSPLRAFCAKNIDVVAIGEGALVPWKKATDFVQQAYREHLFGAATLQDLPDTPRFVIGATNFGTGVSFRFSKPYAGDYRIGLIPNPTFPLSLAVAASSGFPPVLSPVVVKPDPNLFVKTAGADLYDTVAYRRELVLTDGGVYDNLGLESVWNRYETVLVSDAGAPFAFIELPDTSWMQQSLRAMDVATNQARALRKRALISDYQQQTRKGAYWGIMTPISAYGLTDTLPCPLQATRELAALRTRLNAFDEREQSRLINWGYAVCDAALRKWLGVANQPPATWPYPAFALEK